MLYRVRASQKTTWLLRVLWTHLAWWSLFPMVPFYMKHSVASKPCYCLFSHNVPLCMASKSMLEHKGNHMSSTQVPKAICYICYLLYTRWFLCVCGGNSTLHSSSCTWGKRVKYMQLIQKAYDYSFPFSCGNKLPLRSVSTHSCTHTQTHSWTTSYPMCSDINNLLILCLHLNKYGNILEA